MLKRLVHVITVLVAPLALGCALVAGALGVQNLESDYPTFSYAYSALGMCALALVIAPRSWCLSMFAESRKVGVCICLIAAAMLMYRLIPQAPQYHPTMQSATVLNWGAALACCILGMLIWDSQRGTDYSRALFQRADWWLALACTVVALAVRLMEPPGAAADEAIVFGDTFQWLPGQVLPPLWGFTTAGVAHLLNYFVFHLMRATSGLIDPFELSKIIPAFMGALSVGATYLLVRVFAARHVAVAAGLILVMMGWHWLNSRFNYVYPHDLANIAVGALCAVVAFETRRAAPAFLAGIIIAYTIVLQKIGLMLAPFIIYLFCDYLLKPGRGTRKGVCAIAATIVVAVIVAYLPVWVGTSNEEMNQNLATAIAQRKNGFTTDIKDEALKMSGILVDAFYQLQVKMFDIPRHVWRDKAPILDPLSSIFFSIGVVFALIYGFRTRECRLQLAGLLIFMLPMALSFPLNSEGTHGLARRMVGATFFVAWIASYGARVVATRLVAAPRVPLVSVVLGLAVMSTNLFHLHTAHRDIKRTTWVADEGGARAAMTRACRAFARIGYTTVVLNEFNTTINGMNRDLPHLHVAINLEQLRQMLTQLNDRWVVVVIPSGMNTEHAPRNVQALTDLIPPHEWIFGPVDFTGFPMLRYVIRPPTR